MIEIKKHERAREFSDITITMSDNTGQRKQFGLVTFRNDVWKQFGSEYVKFMYDEKKGRLYMFGSDKKEGYHMYSRSSIPEKSKNRYLRVGQKAFVDMIRDLIGDYDVRYDGRMKAHYVQIGVGV